MNVLEGPQELLMGAPATLGSHFPDSARWEVTYHKNLNPYNFDTNFVSLRKKTLTCDAFGSMKTTFGTFDVIRVHEYITDLDSISSFLPIINYTWDTLYYADTLNNYQFWAKGVHYPLAIVHCDKNNNILYTEFLVDTIACYSITGNVFNNTGTQVVKAGTTNLILRDNWDHLFDWIETVPIDSNGHFQFADVVYFPGDNYLVQANPDTTQYPYLVPTYFGDSITWQEATSLPMTKDTNITIHCQNDSLLAMLTGSISISGTIWMDTTATNPVVNPINPTVARGVKVILVQNPGGGCSSVRHTDNNGKYNFTNLPAKNYKLIVDIPGLNMNHDTTYWINVGSTSTAYTDRDFIYDTSLIYIYSNANIVEHNINNIYDVSIYPNPFNGVATVYISNPNSENRIVKFTIYDIAGRIIKEVNANNTEYLSITSDGLAKGMYIYEIRVNNEIINSGKVVVN